MPCPSRVLPLGYLPPTWAHPSAIPAALPWPLRESSPGESETEGRGPCPHYMPERWENQAQSLSSIQAASQVQGSLSTALSKLSSDPSLRKPSCCLRTFTSASPPSAVSQGGHMDLPSPWGSDSISSPPCHPLPLLTESTRSLLHGGCALNFSWNQVTNIQYCAQDTSLQLGDARLTKGTSCTSGGQAQGAVIQATPPSLLLIQPPALTSRM